MIPNQRKKFSALQIVKAVPIYIVLVAVQVHGQPPPLDNWAARTNVTSRHLMSVAYGQGTYVAVGGLPPFNPSDPIQPSLLASSNGINWASLPLPTNANFYGVSYVNNQFIAIGNSGLIMSSPDGLSWTVQNSWAPNQTLDIYPLSGVAFGNGTYVGMTRLLGNSCLVSTNGTNWAKKQLQAGSGFIEMNRVHFDRGLFVAGGAVNNPAILTSSNGVNWSVHYLPVSNSSMVNDSVYAAGRWVAVCDLAAIITSSDAVTWTKANVPSALVTANINFHGVTYYDGYFVAVGGAGPASGTILSSPDGIHWTVSASPGTGELNGITVGNGCFLTAGLSGAIVQSGPLLNLSIGSHPQGTALTLSSPAGIQCTVRASSDLTAWTDLVSIPLTQQLQTFVDTNAATAQHRFYRAVTR